jgi:hypothetical protein
LGSCQAVHRTSLRRCFLSLPSHGPMSVNMRSFVLNPALIMTIIFTWFLENLAWQICDLTFSPKDRPFKCPCTSIHTLGLSQQRFSPYEATEYLFCDEGRKETPNGTLYFWIYLFYLSKFYELIDTLLIVLRKVRFLVLTGDRKKNHARPPQTSVFHCVVHCPGLTATFFHFVT